MNQEKGLAELFILKIDFENEIDKTDFENDEDSDNSYQYMLDNVWSKEIDEEHKIILDKTINNMSYDLEEAYHLCIYIIMDIITELEKEINY